ncbi:MAG: outer membrane protein OmpA-like peptidoglycan-associated protein [Myxococcota bacterium]|jgi:outer membrane protein OmpA-like peptidoglycan-associated protein
MRFVTAIALSTLFASSAAAQQEGFDAHGFSMTANDGDVRDPVTVLRAGAIHQGEFWATGVVDFSDDPLVRELSYADGRPTEVERIIDSLVAFNLSAGVAVHDRVRLDVAVPMYLASSSEGQATGAGIGDVRLAVYSPIVQTKPRAAGGLGLAVSPYLVLPTGDETRFLGQNGITGGFDVAVTYELEALTLTGSAGPRFNPSLTLNNQLGADQIIAGAAVGVHPAQGLGITLEGRIASSLAASNVKGTTSPAEILASVRYRVSNGLHFLAGGGTGVNAGAGASAYRLFFGVGFGRIELNYADRDIDGIVNERDECPDDAETYNSYEDTDGCPDAGGRVLLTAAINGDLESDVYVSVTSGGETQQIETLQEAIPMELAAGTYEIEGSIPGFYGREMLNIVSGEYPIELDMEAVVPGYVSIRTKDAAGRVVESVGLSIIGPGAPLDATRRLGPQGLDRYELPPGRYLVFLKAQGVGIYRRNITLESNQELMVDAVLRDPRAVVEGDRITVTEKIYFETGSDVIQDQSFDLLEEIAALLASEERVRRVQIQGHTDAQGSDEMNLDLSDRRAAAVRSFLIAQGIEEGRLQSRGFGEQVPIADNSTEAGLARNRRVEFRILEMD